MKITDLWKAYDTYTETASTLARQLNFAALATIWIFKIETVDGDYAVPAGLVLPSVLIILSLTFDFLQYVYGSLLYHRLGNKKEAEQFANPETFDADFEIRRRVLLPMDILFYGKLALVFATYVMLLIYLAGVLFGW